MSLKSWYLYPTIICVAAYMFGTVEFKASWILRLPNTADCLQVGLLDGPPSTVCHDRTPIRGSHGPQFGMQNLGV
jgi:hypothetical protein